MKIKNIAQISLFSLVSLACYLNHKKSKKIEEKLENLEEKVDRNFIDFSTAYNKHVKQECERFEKLSKENEEIKDEICSVYEHMTYLSENKKTNEV